MTDSISTTMRVLLRPDRHSKNLILTTFPVPIPDFTKNEHLIKVQTVAPCAGELLWPENFPEPDPGTKIPIPCYDVAGTILLAPENSPFKIGDSVYALTEFARTGDAREYTIATTEELALKPENLSWAEAATVPLSSLTAWQALFVQAGLGSFEDGRYMGKRVLVTAASGGVGSWAVQFAKLVGAEVIGTCGPDNVEFVKSLGADKVLNYREVSLKEWAGEEGNKVDVVLDCIGGKSLEDAWWSVKDGGLVMSICQPPEGVKPSGRNNKNFFFIVSPDGPSLTKISALLRDGKVKPVLDSVYNFDNYEDAFKKLDSGHARGKIVLDILA